MKRWFPALIAAVLMASLVASATLGATPKITSVGTWKVSSGPNYTLTKAMSANGVVGFTFRSTPASYVDLLTTTKARSLLGDLTGKTIQATFTVTASTNAVFAYDLTDNPCTPGVAFVRPYFKSNLGGAFAVTNYWWANPIHYTFVNGTTATKTLTVPINTANWSDWNGQLASTVPAEFAQAVTNVGEIGLSFGGGCFFANGVGLSAGSASFQLTSYSVS